MRSGQCDHPGHSLMYWSVVPREDIVPIVPGMPKSFYSTCDQIISKKIEYWRSTPFRALLRIPSPIRWGTYYGQQPMDVLSRYVATCFISRYRHAWNWQICHDVDNATTRQGITLHYAKLWWAYSRWKHMPLSLSNLKLVSFCGYYDRVSLEHGLFKIYLLYIYAFY